MTAIHELHGLIFLLRYSVSPSLVCCVQVHFVLVDEAGNQMQSPSIQTGLTAQDVWAPELTMRTPCDVPVSDDCLGGSGAMFCDNVGDTYINAHFMSDEAGAVYYRLTELPTSTSVEQRAACRALAVHPGMLLSVPGDELWSGCVAPAETRRRLASDAVPPGNSLPSSGIEAGSPQHNRHLTDATAQALQDVPCDPDTCCDTNTNCRRQDAAIWPQRQNEDASGTILSSACAYMTASTCIRMPVAGLNLTELIGANALLSPAMELEPTTPAQVASGVSDLHPATIEPAFASTGLVPDTFYGLYVVSEDEVQPVSNLPAVARQFIFRTQSITPPACNISCLLADATEDSVALTVRLNTTGEVFFVLQRNSDAIDVPSATNVRFSMMLCVTCL